MRQYHFVPFLLAALLAVPAAAVERGDPSELSDLITIETSEKPLDVVLQWISRRAGVNIVTNEENLDNVTLRLVNVTWQEAIDQIARRYGYVVEKRSDRIWELTKPPKVRLELFNAQLPVVLEALARQAQVNIVISDAVDVNRRLTLKLKGVPWREALDVIVKTTGFVWIEQKYNIIRVVDPADVQKDLQTRIVRLNHVDGNTAQQIIQVALSADGEVSFDGRTRSLVVTDTPVSLNAAFDIIEQIDRRPEQVQIEMKFVEYNTQDALALGFSGSLQMNIDGFGQIEQSFFPFATSAGRYLRVASGEGETLGPMPQVPSSTSMSLGALSFEAVSTFSSTEVIQSPTLLTLNNELAKIQITQEIRFAETTVSNENGQIIRSLQEAESSPVEDGITIEVQPYITSDGFITMSLKTSDATNEFRKFDVGEDSIELPQLREKVIETSIMVADGDTAVIGGILQNQVDEGRQKVPLLGDIPVLGWLFRRKEDRVTQRNLTIFITPHIVEMTGQDRLEESKLLIREELSGLKLRQERKVQDARLGNE